MTNEEIIIFFDKLLVRDLIISKETLITDVVCQLDINSYGQPILVGSFALGENFHTIEYVHNKSWQPINLEKKIVQEEKEEKKKITNEEDLPLEVKMWFRRLPADPDLIPKGQQREWLRDIPEEMLHHKYPPDQHPTMYNWLKTTKPKNE